MKYLNLPQNRKPLVWACVMLFFLFFTLSFLTPMLADDYSYSFSYADRSRINSISDIISSLAAHRVDMNGRMAAHFFAHLFLMQPKIVFCLANSLIVLGIFYLIYLTLPGTDDRQKFIVMLMVFFLVWLYTPVFGQVFLWLDGACNYAWAFFFIYAFIFPYCRAYLFKCSASPFGKLGKFFFLLLAFLAGSYSEGASFGMLFIAFCFLLCLWHRDRKLPRFLVLALITAALGYLYLMTAPSEWSGRTGSFSIETIAKNIKRMISAPQETMMPLFSLYAVLLAACVCFKRRREIIVTSVILFLGAWASIVLFAVAIYFPWRSLLMMSMLLVISCALMLSELCNAGFRRYLPMAAALAGSLFIFQFALGLGDIANVYSQYIQREAAIETAIENGEMQIWLQPYVADTKYSGAYLLADIYEDCWSWPNYDLADYYGINEVYALPSEVWQHGE